MARPAARDKQVEGSGTAAATGLRVAGSPLVVLVRGTGGQEGGRPSSDAVGMGVRLELLTNLYLLSLGGSPYVMMSLARQG